MHGLKTILTKYIAVPLLHHKTLAQDQAVDMLTTGTVYFSTPNIASNCPVSR